MDFPGVRRRLEESAERRPDEVGDSTGFEGRFRGFRYRGRSHLDTAPGETVEEVGEEPVKGAMRANGDRNSPHNYPGFGNLLAEETGILPAEALHGEGLVVQGAEEAAHAVREAGGKVESMHAEYGIPLDSRGEMEEVRDFDYGVDEGMKEVVEYLRSDLPEVEEERGPAGRVEMEVSPDSGRTVNRENSAKVLDSLSHFPYEGHILLETDAEFGEGGGPQDVEGEVVKVREGGEKPYDLFETEIRYGDGTVITHTTLGIDPEVYAEVLERYAEEVGARPRVRGGTPLERMVEAQTDYVTSVMETGLRMQRAAVDAMTL